MIAALLLAVIACTPLPTCTVPVTVSPCATPTPVVQWSNVTDADLSGYELYWRNAGGGIFGLLARLPCEWYDTDDDPLTPPAISCRGADFAVPLQRYCPGCTPNNEYEFAVKAYDTGGLSSLAYSNIVTICFSPICVAPGPCS